MRNTNFQTILFFTLSLFCCFTHSAVSVPSLKEYGNLPTISHVAISPNGDLVAFRRSIDNQEVVSIYSLKQQKNIAFINISEIDPHDLYFLSDNQLILVVYQHKKLRGYREAMDISTAYAYDIANSKLKQLVRMGEKLGAKNRVYTGQSGVGGIVGHSPDKQFLFIPAYVTEYKYNTNSYLPNYSLLKVNVSDNSKPEIYEKGTPHVVDYFVGDQGQLLARESFLNKEQIHRVEARQGKKWVVLYEEKDALRTRNFRGLTSDFSKLVFTTVEANSNHNAYFTLSLKDGSVDRLNLGRKDASIEALITTRNGAVQGIRYSGFNPEYRFFDERLNKRLLKIQEKTPEHSVWLEDWSQDWQHILVQIEGSSYAGDYFIFSKGKDDPMNIASSYPAIKTEQINPIGRINLKARDGLPIPSLLTIPRKDVKQIKNLPAVIFPHGGPATYDRIGFDFIAQALASRGFLVVQPQFRGSTGFGLAHRNAAYGEWGKKMQHDITDTVNALIEKGIVDRSKVCIVGASYGGYAALSGAAFTPELYQCAVSINGVSHVPKFVQSFKGLFGTSPPRSLWYLEDKIGGGELESEALRQISPYFHADAIKIPVLLIHAVDDKVVDYQQSELMYSKLKRAGIESKLVRLKGKNHFLKKSETRQKALEETVNFVLKHITADG